MRIVVLGQEVGVDGVRGADNRGRGALERHVRLEPMRNNGNIIKVSWKCHGSVGLGPAQIMEM